MNILWIAQLNLNSDLNVSTWLEMTKSLLKRGHRITFIALGTSNQRDYLSWSRLTLKIINVIDRFPLVAISFQLQVMVRSLFWVVRIRPDIVIVHPITAIFLLPTRLLAWLFRLKIKFVLDVRTLPVRFSNLNDAIKNRLVSFSIWLGKYYFHGITVTSPSLQRIIGERFDLDPAKIGVWTSGVNPDFFHPDIGKIAPACQSKEKMIVMYHGALAENRGLLETIEAMRMVKNEINGIKLLILGKGPGYKKLVESVERLDIKDGVQFLDPVPYDLIPEQIAQADIGIIPLPDELCWQVSSPLKLFEYLAMAKPVLLSPIEAHTAVVNDCHAAIFMKDTSPEAIAQAMITAYSRRSDFQNMGMKGRELMLAQFTWDNQARNLEEFLQRI